MSKRKFVRSVAFTKVTADIEDEILETYSESLENDDFFLHELPNFFSKLDIPNCFIKDINLCIDYYYDYIHGKDVEYNPNHAKQSTTLQFIKSYTITPVANDIEAIIDVVDIDKLVKNCCKLIKFRNNYNLIYDSWSLFVGRIIDKKTDITSHKLTLPHLQKIKKDLGLDNDLSDSLLIDMLGSCATVDGEIVNYDWEKVKSGKYVTIKDFAEIMGQLGELD
ncbi:DNA repair protein Rad33p [[Candida] anglica]|uniref:DNA repair protein Rad33p n=1 Tax=[Candida] anglica TaxID=148631 RepID=A0ABP0EA15_9ASCO